jgi:hypothetical protein
MTSVVRSFFSVACVGAAVVALGACNRDRTDRDRGALGDRPVAVDNNDRPGLGTDKGPGTTTVTGANVGTVGNQAAVDRIVAARCAREVSCNNVGADKSFQSTGACSQKLRGDMKDDLNANDCPRGIDQKELNECLEEIRNEKCGNPIDTISRLAACRTSDMCLKTDTPNR